MLAQRKLVELNKVKEKINSVSPSEAAVIYAKIGIPVVPIHFVVKSICSCGDKKCNSPGKHPIGTKHGFKEATTDLAKIGHWFRQYPNANVGTITGLDSDLEVYDVDPRNGGLETHSLLMKTMSENFGGVLSVTTGRGDGGTHYYFRPSRRGKKRSPGKGLDFLTNGAGVILPPSIHLLGRKYNWNIGKNEIRFTPNWLYKSKKSADVTNTNDKLSYNHITSKMVLEGHRNESLVSFVGYLIGKRVCPIIVFQIAKSVNKTNFSPPLLDSEVEQIVNSICGRELNKIRGEK